MNDPIIVIKQEIYDLTAHHRLAIFTIEIPPSPGSNFHSLAWGFRAVQATSGWVDQAVITREDFQRDTDRRRWVQTLDRFDLGTGYAIIQVGEGDVPRHERRPTHITYSWREWDIRNNRQVRLLRICDNPMETSYE